MMLKKYYQIFKYCFIRTLQFRAEIIVYSFLDIIPFFVLFFLWGAVYSGQTYINGYSYFDIVQYYIMVVFVQRITATYFEGWRSQEIRMGKIDYFLTRPFSYINEILSREIGGKIINLSISIPILTAFYFISIKIFSVPSIQLNLNNFFIFILLIVSAYAIQIMVALWIVLLTFWFEGSSGLEHFKWIVLSLFSGSTIPYEFMPIWLQKIFDFLPFKYTSYVPIQLIMGKISLTYKDYLSVILTLLVMFFITRILLKKALYKYSSAGG